jgi:hypothetical protein
LIIWLLLVVAAVAVPIPELTAWVVAVQVELDQTTQICPHL